MHYLVEFGQEENAFSYLDLFDASVLGLTFMDQPIDYVRENSPQWAALQKIWRIVEEDYELRKSRDEFLSYLEREHNEGIKAVAEWRSYVKQKQATKA